MGYLKGHASSWQDDLPVDWIVGELEELVELLGNHFERVALNEEIVGLKLYTEDDQLGVEDEEQDDE